MNRKRKLCNKYYISVEGETEKWYFQKLQELINNCEEAAYNVNFKIKVEKSPISFIKTLNPHGEKFIHICDRESNDEFHKTQFSKILKELKDSEKLKKGIGKYKLGYTNYSFELWILLHKDGMNKSISHRKDYIKDINRVYGTTYNHMDDYKHEKNFKKLLSGISLEDVKLGITNAKGIREYQKSVGRKMVNELGFCYCRENPDLTIDKCIEMILEDCKIIKKQKN